MPKEPTTNEPISAGAEKPAARGISPLGNSPDKAQDTNMPPRKRAARAEANQPRSPSDAGANSINENLTSLPGNFADLARAFLDAAEAIERSGSEAADRATPFERQTATLKRWAEKRGLVIPPGHLEELPLVSNSTSEHEVRFDEARQRAVKKTWAGFYGQIPVAERGRLGRRNATPAEYLRRMALQTAVFGGDLKLEGVCVSDSPSMIIGQPAGEPSLVVSQEWFAKLDAPSLDEIARFLTSEGFTEIPGSYLIADCVIRLQFFRSRTRMILLSFLTPLP